MDDSGPDSTVTVVARIRQISREHPTRGAVEFGSSVMSYATLDVQSSRLAACLRERFGVSRGSFVGICLESSPTAMVAILAILKAGAAYVPLDADLPKQRLSYMIRDTGLKVVLTQRKFSVDIALSALEPGALRMLLLDQDQSWQAPRDDWDESACAPTPSDLAYLIYTSGSTGIPKGVMVEHRGLLNLSDASARLFDISERSRVVQFSSLSFDAAVWEIFTALVGGGTLVLGARTDMLPGRALATFLARNRINWICIPPSLLASMLDAKEDLACLHTVVAGAEACPLAVARAWAKGGRRFFNAYGPTETTVCATTYRFMGSEDSVPIGVPLPGVHTYVVDETLQRVPAGQAGELCIGGIGVGRGYLHKPELNARVFIRSPWSDETLYRTGDIVVENAQTGLLEFVGRRDNQVKVRGYRIEIEAIEHALSEHPGVQNAAVAVVELQTPSLERSKTLVGYFVARPGADPEGLSQEGVTRFLVGKLPHYMVPPIYVQLDVMPMKANRSKIDRAALPLPTAKRTGSQPLTDRTRQIATLFDQALNLPLGTIQQHDHFFQMGGNSMDVAHLLMALKTEFGVQVPARTVYVNPTPAAMDAAVEAILSSPYFTTAAEVVDLAKEARLKDDFPLQIVAGPATPKIILLTGGTGFMGAALLQELLSRDATLKVYCLVRSDSEESARERLEHTFQNYGLAVSVLERVCAIPGDIENVTLGLAAAEYARLSLEVDTVYHCAADINYSKPYALVKGPNVDGTHNVLRFACAGSPKTLQYVSTAGLFGATAALLGINDVLEDYDIKSSIAIMAIENGYAKSKWIAERLVQAAAARGLRAGIYRLGFIEGSSRTGIANIADLLCRMICGCIQMGVYPNFPEKYWIVTPVDFAANAIAHISLSGGTGPYHIVVDHDKDARHNDMFETINALGFPVRRIDPADWFEALATCSPDNALYPITSYLLEKVHEGRNTILEAHYRTEACANTRTHEALAGSGTVVPTIDAELIAKYLSYFVSCGLIKRRAVTE